MKPKGGHLILEIQIEIDRAPHRGISQQKPIKLATLPYK